jgi:N-acetyltransferase
MQLDLASQQRKTCTCGMEYVPSNAQDAALHSKFHAANAGGVDCTRAMVERLRGKQVWGGGEDGGFVACVGRRDAAGLRKKASEVLHVVNTELAAVPIEDEELWSQMTLGPEGDSKAEKCDRFKAFLYIRGYKCVGACLAERVSGAYAVLGQGGRAADELHEQEQQQQEQQQQIPAASSSSSSSHSSSISVSTTADPAVLLGISRIWVSSASRRRGLARTLLDCARANFSYGLVVDKRRTAFSQPTESGGRLARRYFGCEAGWHVYMG